jgi:hypothetical protein
VTFPTSLKKSAASGISKLIKPFNFMPHYKETVSTLHGQEMQLTACVHMEPWDKFLRVDTWGRVEGKGRPLYPPRFTDKSIARFGGIKGYLESKERELFYHISIGQYLAFNQRAIEHSQ